MSTRYQIQKGKSEEGKSKWERVRRIRREGERREVGFTESTNKQNTHLTSNVALCVMEVVNHVYHNVTLNCTV